MGRAKDILVKVIPAKAANAFVKKFHYSGKVVNNSSLHFGCFLDGTLGGVMSFGSPLDKRKVLPLVVDASGNPCLWNEMLELSRMAFSELLPRNSESRCMAIAFRLLKKNAKHIKWILSFSDGTQCGDGTIYRAAGFELTGLNQNKSLLLIPGGPVISEITLRVHFRIPQVRDICKRMGIDHKFRTTNDWLKLGAKKLPGYQLRYIKLLHPELKLNCSSLPYSAIDEAGAGMYKGEKITIAKRQQAHEAKGDEAPTTSREKGGAGPTRALNLNTD